MNSRARTLGLLVLCVLVAVSLSSGGVKISPTSLTVNSPSRSCAMTVTNPLDRDQEVWIEVRYGYETTNDSGVPRIEFKAADSLGNEPSARQFIRAFPSRFVLPPGSSQVVRLVAAPPAALPDGEYWARVVAASQPTSRLLDTSRLQSGIRAGFTLVTKSDVPFHFRKGRLTTGVAVGGVRVDSQQRDSIRVSVELTRTGNASFLGTATCRLKDGQGRVVSTRQRTIVVYKQSVAAFRLLTANVPAGQYTLDINIAARQSRDPLASVDSRPVNYSTTVTLQ